jgi:hypothetical protein
MSRQIVASAMRDKGQLAPSRCFASCEREELLKRISELQGDLMNTDIDRIKEVETDAAIDAHMADAVDQFWEEKELLNTLTVQFAEVVAFSKQFSGVTVLFGFPHCASPAEISLQSQDFERLFGNNPDVYDATYENFYKRAIDMNGVKVYCNMGAA